MSFFAYKNGEMHAEGVALAAIAAQVGTPFYCYSAGALRSAWREFAQGVKGMNASVCYAMKANSNLAVIRLFGELGAGADIVSAGEMRRALAAGIPARRIIYSGVGKKASELMAALQAGVGQINVESSAELETLNAVAAQLGVRADITIRVNPDVDAETHAKITTGRKDNKFGIDIDLAREAFALAGRLAAAWGLFIQTSGRPRLPTSSPWSPRKPQAWAVSSPSSPAGAWSGKRVYS